MIAWFFSLVSTIVKHVGDDEDIRNDADPFMIVFLVLLLFGLLFYLAGKR